ncbi:MAG: S8 family serine peptidase [Actinomycetota bacterium]
MRTRTTRWVAILAALLMTGVLATPVAADLNDVPPADDGDTGRYVVVMTDVPLVTEFGADAVTSAAAQSRAEELIDDQEDALRSAGLSRDAAARNFTVSLNGFAVELTEGQAERMKGTDGVLMVLEDFLRQPQTDNSIQFLGLTAPNGSHNVGNTGEGVIVGIIDSGIWPEHPSFADDGTYPDPGVVLDESVFPACDFGNTAHHPDDAPFECNNKLIGARQMIPTYRAVVGAEDYEFDSARDEDGHGSHVAATAAGNAGVEATVLGERMGIISGVAPRAHIIAYKGLGELGGFTSDLAGAVDQAVLDGVDVINYSIGGGAGGIGADEIAFLFAADAGVHVATSAGNSGPGPETIGDPATKPWLTSVGASTHTRKFQGTVRLSGGPRIQGVSITGSTSRIGMVDAADAGSELCLPGELDEEMVAGKIVLCRRGSIARLGKSFAVYAAGGAGMILYNNNDTDDLISDSHFVPSVHVNLTDGLKIKRYIERRRPPTAWIIGGQSVRDRSAPVMANFSSRGADPVARDIIKPDITAPGVQVLAATTPVPIPGTLPPGELFMAIAGTSMSSPHVAGLMALIDQIHPDWSPAAVKSAIMTTAHQDVENADGSAADPFDMGAGHIDPQRPARRGSPFKPGLVYEAGTPDYLGFICDAFAESINPATCAALESLGVPTDATGLNYPSIGVSELAGSQTITRTVTSVATGEGRQVYRPIIEAPDGYEVTVSPKRLRISEGESATYQVTITNVDAPVGEWRHGAITWRSFAYQVRSPISVRGVDYAAPAQVDGSGESGAAEIPITFGYSGPYSAAGHGLEPATVFADNVLQDPDQTFDPADVGNGAVLHEVTTSGAALLRIAMPPDATEASADLDIFVIGPAGNTIAQSTAAGTDELIDIVLPADGTYQIYVHGWSAPGGDSDYLLYTWVVSATPGGNLSVDSAPGSATLGSTENIGVSWSGATEGQWHLGAVSHSGPAGLMGLSLVNVDNR